MDGIKHTKTEPSKIIFSGHCPALSGGTLTYEIGTDLSEEKLALRVIESSGGADCSEIWTWDDNISRYLESNDRLTGVGFFEFQSGRNRNTGAFLLAAMLDIGLVSRNDQDQIFSNHIPQANFMQLAVNRTKKIAQKKIKEKKLPPPKL